ncbi:MAG: ribose 5-phosphate isomerase [Acidobacteria bacterium]|jgi:ribose 5-phosphate isomerase B|nr:ribose 5-phosphate isomerase [Acidobacteriota bacterium]
MRVLFASDHAGLELKRLLVEAARAGDVDAVDLGPLSPAAVDYPQFAHDLARRIAAGEAERGVLVCGTGIGMAMAANRHRGVRAALCHDAFTAEMARRHNDANVLCLGGRTTAPADAVRMLELFLTTPFEGGRHERRVAAIDPAS